MTGRYKSVETKYMEARDRMLRALRGLDCRTFFKVSAPPLERRLPKA